MNNEILAHMNKLVSEPHEELNIEVKSWLDLNNSDGRATLAKAILALANHGSGFVLIGFSELRDGTFIPDANRPGSLDAYSQDAISGIIQAYAKPAFHCNVHMVQHPQTNESHPVIVVPGDHRVPIQCIKGSPNNRTLLSGKYYIRRPGPQSAEPNGTEEWRDLVMRCVRAGRDDLLDAIRDVFAGRSSENIEAIPTNEIDLFKEWVNQATVRWQDLAPNDGMGGKLSPLGYYRVAYHITGDFQRPALNDLLKSVSRSEVKHSGWPPFWVPTKPDIAPKPYDGYIECSFLKGMALIKDPAHADFWRVTPEGYAILIRGFDEDSYPDRLQPGTSFDITLPIWRIGECMLQAAALARNLGADQSDIRFQVDWHGLSGRELLRLEGLRHVRPGQIADADEIERVTYFKPQELEDTLPEILREFLSPLYTLFNFFELQPFLVEQEVQRMRQGRF